MGKQVMSWEEVADFLEAAQAIDPRAHAIACLTALHGLSVEALCTASVEDLIGSGAQPVLHIRMLAGTSLVPMALTPRAAAALAASVGPRATGPLLLDDNGGPLTSSAARRIVNAVARSAGLGDRLDPRSGR